MLVSHEWDPIGSPVFTRSPSLAIRVYASVGYNLLDCGPPFLYLSKRPFLTHRNKLAL